MSAKHILAVLVILGAIMGWVVYSQWREYVRTANPSSGIRGTVLVGPTCPALPANDSGKCGDRPYPTELSVYTVRGALVKTVSSGPDGKFTVSLLPGRYVIGKKFSEQSILPYLETQQVEVQEGKFTEVRLTFDSGIR